MRLRRRSRAGLCCAAWLAAACCAPALAGEPDAAVEQIVSVLRERGLIDAAQQTQILARSAAEARRAAGPWQGLQLYGDLRLRGDGMYFGADELGAERRDRVRARYRVRLGLQKELAEGLRVGVRLASNTGDARGSNVNLGEDPDLQPDPIRIDLAYAEYAPGETASGLRSAFSAGRMENPLRWKHGPDYLVWDGDLQMEGASLRLTQPFGERAWLFATGGYYVLQERDLDSDPRLAALQLGGGLRPRDGVELGVRASAYSFHALDAALLARSQSRGNLANGFGSERARVGELGGYLRLAALPRWPLLLWADAARGFDAHRAVIAGARVGEENDAIALGAELGDPGVARFSAVFFQLEANAVLGQFTESDAWDGMTNARGWLLSVTRELRPGIELRLGVSKTDALRSRGGASGPFAASLPNRDRHRVIGDLSLRF